MITNRLSDSMVSPINAVARGVDQRSDPVADTIRVQLAVESAFGAPNQILGGKAGSLTLRYPWSGFDVVATFQRCGALVLSSGMTPIRIGGPAVVPTVVAVHGAITLIARGRVVDDQLAGLDIIMAEPGPLGSANPEVTFALLRDTLQQMPDPDEALIGFLFQILDTRFAQGSERGHQLMGRVLSALGDYVRSGPGSALQLSLGRRSD